MELEDRKERRFAKKLGTTQKSTTESKRGLHVTIVPKLQLEDPVHHLTHNPRILLVVCIKFENKYTYICFLTNAEKIEISF